MLPGEEQHRESRPRTSTTAATGSPLRGGRGQSGPAMHSRGRPRGKPPRRRGIDRRVSLDGARTVAAVWDQKWYTLLGT